MDSVFLSTYQLRAKNSRLKGYTMLNQFNGTTDLFPLLVKFLNELLQTTLQLNNDEETNTRLNLTLLAPPTVLHAERIVYGYFDAGVTGQPILVKERVNKATVFEGDRDRHGLYRHLFFFFQLPINQDRGYVIFQKRARFGVKSAFTGAFKKWIRDQGFQDSSIWIHPVLNGQVFNRMLDAGKLRKVNFVVNFVPDTLDSLMLNNEQSGLAEGTMTTVLESKHGLPEFWKRFARTQYLKEDRKTLVEFTADDEQGEKEFSEIEFELTLNGRSKTFYANQKYRTVPDIDVTGEVNRDSRTGEPYLDSLLEKCREIVTDTFEIKPDAKPN